MDRNNKLKNKQNARIHKNVSPYNSYVRNNKALTLKKANELCNTKNINKKKDDANIDNKNKLIRKRIIIRPYDNDNNQTINSINGTMHQTQQSSANIVNKMINNYPYDNRSRIIPIGFNNLKEESTFITELIKSLIFNDEKPEEKEDTKNLNENKTFDLTKKYIELDSIQTLDDLIKLGKSYDKNTENEYPIDLKRLNSIVEPLENLQKVIGMDNVKKSIINQVIFFLLNLEPNKDMLHTIVQGPPGVGKTMLGEILGKIYYNMNIIKHSKKNKEFKFKVVKRQDLIGQYLGQTAMKTQQVIDECIGGVMFIDEAYSLGNEEKKDIYSKEALDTLNQNLSEKAGEFVCIIAGYPDELDKCFFSVNEGLKRRFTFRYTIDKYNSKELSEILLKKIKDSGWFCDEESITLETLTKFINDKYSDYPNFGGDMETLLFHIKVAHAYRIFGKHPSYRKKITISDIKEGHKLFMLARESDKKGTSHLTMFL